MATMNISLPDELKTFVDRQVADNSYMTSSEYIRSLVRADQEKARLRTLIVEGMESGPPEPMDDAYFERKREYVRQKSRRAG